MPQARNGDKAKSDKAEDVGNKAMSFSILIARKVLGELEKLSEQKTCTYTSQLFVDRLNADRHDRLS